MKLINAKDPTLNKNHRLQTLLNLIKHYATENLSNLFEKIYLF